jgi:hypothetical protein
MLYNLESILKNPIAIDIIRRLSASQLIASQTDMVIPADNIVCYNHRANIPTKDMNDRRTVFITDKKIWIIFIQSNTNKNMAWAWEIAGDPYIPTFEIRPCNDQLRQEGWHLGYNRILIRHIEKYKTECQEAYLTETNRNNRYWGTSDLVKVSIPTMPTNPWNLPQNDIDFVEIEERLRDEIIEMMKRNRIKF